MPADRQNLSTSNLLFRLLLTLVLLAPLPFGAARDWAAALMAVTAGLLLGAWGISAALGRIRVTVPLSRLWPVAVPYAAVLLWGAVQSASWLPDGWHHPLWAEAALALGSDGVAAPGAMSLDPRAGWTGLMRLLSYAGIFFLAVQLGRGRGRARLALVAFAWAGIAYALYGLIVYFSGFETILWMEKWAYRGQLTATFVNRNSYGAYAGLGLCCCLALFAHALPAGGLRRRDPRIVAEELLLGALPYLIGAGILATALMLTHSRGAFLAAILGVIVLMTALGAGRVVKARRAVTAAFAVVMLGAGILIGGDEVTLERLAGPELRADDRTELFRLTTEAIIASPWTGQGLGSFEPALRIYRDTSLGRQLRYDHAHNMYLETALEFGLPGAAALLGAIAAALAICMRGLRKRRRDQIYPALAIAAGAVLGAHNMVDFSLAMPAVAASFALLLGIGYAQSWSTSEPPPQPPPPPSDGGGASGS